MSRLQDKLNRLNNLHLEGQGPAKPPTRGKGKKWKSSGSISTEKFDEHFFANGRQPLGDPLTFLKTTASSQKLEDYFPEDFNRIVPGRQCLVLRRNLSGFWTDAPSFTDYFRGPGIAGGLPGVIPHPPHLNRVCFLDIETCGFSGTPLFLIGIGFLEEGELFLVQYFARDFSEEGEVLKEFWRDFSRFHTLVTFNGISFDWPFIEERSYYCGQTPREIALHLDLLVHARKNWKGKTPNLKLQTLERYYCLREREGDLPGSAIPEAYNRFIESPQNPGEMAAAIHHNALDVVTLMELFAMRVDGKSPVDTYLK